MANIPDAEKEHRLAHLMDLRADMFEELEELEKELVSLRMQIERAESDIRLGGPEPDQYGRLKGHDLPTLERRLMETYNSLLKVEDKILFTRMGESGNDKVTR